MSLLQVIGRERKKPDLSKLEITMFYFQPITRFNIIHTRSTNLFIQSETISIRSHSYLSFYCFDYLKKIKQ